MYCEFRMRWTRRLGLCFSCLSEGSWSLALRARWMKRFYGFLENLLTVSLVFKGSIFIILNKMNIIFKLTYKTEQFIIIYF